MVWFLSGCRDLRKEQHHDRYVEHRTDEAAAQGTDGRTMSISCVKGCACSVEALMELEVTQHVGAERHARTPERTGQRNGYRERRWDTRVGTIDSAGAARAGWQLLPGPARTAAAGGAGARGGRAGSVCPRRLDAAGGRSRAGARHRRHQQERSLAALRDARCRGGAVSHAAR